MTPSYSSAVSKLIQQIEELRRQLQRFSESDLLHSFYTKQSLQKRYKRCLQKLATLTKPALQAGAVLGLAALFHSSSIAQKQPCSNFYEAVNSNPIQPFQSHYTGVSKPFFVDIDADGDYDCYEEYYDDDRNVHVLFLRNKGTKEIPYFMEDTVSGFSASSPAVDNFFSWGTEGTLFADMDADGDYDCLMGKYFGRQGGHILYFENTGNATTPQFIERTGTDNPFSFFGSYYTFRMTLADTDSDGDYDLYTGAYLEEKFFKNIGTPAKPKFKQDKAIYNGSKSHHAFYDWNKDGLIDLFRNNSFYKNVGTFDNPLFTVSNGGINVLGGFSIQQFADINNDGFIDLTDFRGKLATTSPDAAIKADSITKTLQAYPKNTSFTYRWQRNGKPIANANADHFTPKIPGLYTVEITGSCGTGVSHPYRYKTTQKTLIVDDENSFIAPQIVANKAVADGAIKSYPNPFTNSFVLQLNCNTDISKSTIRITDIQGRVVDMMNPNSFVANVGAKLSKGVFVVQVLTADKGVVYQHKVVKE